MTEWSIQNAKSRFSAVVSAAASGEPQHVAKHGKPAVVVLSAEEYERLRGIEQDQNRVPTFPELLLAIPQDGEEF